MISKAGVTIEADVLYDKVSDDYLYYSYNIFFGNNKLMFHYEPTHKEHFQPHINVYAEGKELQNADGEGIHILSHKYHPLEILSLIKRYFAQEPGIRPGINFLLRNKAIIDWEMPNRVGHDDFERTEQPLRL